MKDWRWNLKDVCQGIHYVSKNSFHLFPHSHEISSDNRETQKG